jgi:fatty acid desaturase
VPLWTGIAVALGATIVLAGLPWWANLGLALLLGQAYGAMGFSAHEILHGSTVRDRRLQDALGVVAFAPFLVAPHLWREWHNRRHHTHANQGHHDPDSFGHVRHYEPGAPRHAVNRLLPGSGHILSAPFLFYWFTFHNLFILGVLSRRFKGYDRRPALLQTAVQALLWVGVIALAPSAVLFTVVVPMLVGNFMLMGYIATNHMMRPETDHDDAIENTMSVDVPWAVDVLHGWFSHHVEHHLFPGMNPAMAPRVRAWLRQEQAEAYVSPPLHKALWWLYRTPRPHAGAQVLADPDRPDRRIDLVALTRELRDTRWRRFAPQSEQDRAA